MKRAHLEKIIKQHLRRMKDLCGQVPVTFDVEDIHNLRVEYKKLRAFARLLQTEADASKLKVPGQLKAVYEAAGPVRDLQLFIPLIAPRFSQQPTKQYLEKLFRKLGGDKNNLRAAIDRASFNKIEEMFLNHLPGSLHTETVKKYVRHKISGIKVGLLAIHTDEDLHDIRKQLKDLTYNIKFCQKDFKQSLPAGLDNWEEDLDKATKLLGNYNDFSFAFTFLETNKAEDLPLPEAQLLKQVENNWIAEKENRQKEIIGQLTSLPFLPKEQTIVAGDAR